MGTSNGLGAGPTVLSMLFIALGTMLLLPDGGNTTGTTIGGIALIVLGILIFI